jgi:zinc protease
LSAPIRLRPLVLTAGVCLMLGLAGRAHAQSDLSRAQLVTLANGLRVLLVPDSLATAVEVGAWFDAGVGNEKPGLSGITRLLERLMSRGADSEDRNRRIAATGGVAGSFTLPDAACFYETLPASELELGFRNEAERMKSLTVSPAALESERARMRAEQRARGEGGPGSRGLQRLYAALYPGHPYRLPPSGTDADLARITARDCEDDFRARFSPNRALVTVVGRFEAARALELARAWLEPLPRRAPPAPRPPRAAAARERRVTQRFDFELRLLFVGWRAPGQGDERSVPLELLGGVLSSGSGSRLAREASGPGRDLLVAQAGYEGRREGGLFYAYGALRPGADSAAVEKDLVARIEKLATEPVSAEELEAAKRQAESTTLFGWQAVHGRTTALGAAQLVDGDFQRAWSRVARLRQMGAADLQRAAAGVLKGENRSVVWLVPPGGSPRAGGVKGAPR